ncbi:MAG: type II toxin-antitoxin system VapC family toxin [Gammaproteobacteria bacterium]
MSLIYLDTCLLIYLVEQDPVFSSRIAEAIEREPAASFAISPLVRMECLVRPLRDGNLVIQRRFEHAFDTLVMLDIPAAVFDEAGVLRARFGLRTPEAMHLACAQHHGCQALWTNDDRLARASLGLARSITSHK